MADFQRAYEDKVSHGGLVADPDQANAAKVLNRVDAELQAAHPHGLGRLFHAERSAPREAYLWGPSGRGKSMLMDLFFAQTPVTAKQRVHFHAFMSQVQERLEDLGRDQTDSDEDVFLRAADEIAEQTRLLCFDELEVIDIADAMILGRLFARLFERGVVLVATSNEAPDDLYRDGVNRQLFQPFIDLIKDHTEIVTVSGRRDYRRDRAETGQLYFSPITPQTTTAFDAAWAVVVADRAQQPVTVQVHGRSVVVDRVVQDAARVTFEETCARELGPDDDLALAHRFRMIFLDGVPVLGRDRSDQARRFVILIDALYEAKVQLAVLAQAEPDALFETDDDASRRTVSRLNEMRSASWSAA